MTIDLPDELCRLIVPLLEQCSEDLGNAGCNDFLVPDSPAARELCDAMDAWNCGQSVAAYRESPNYEPPHITEDGKMYLMDFLVLDYFTHLLAKQVKGTEEVR